MHIDYRVMKYRPNAVSLKHDGTDGTPKKRIKNALGLLIKYVNCKKCS